MTVLSADAAAAASVGMLEGAHQIEPSEWDGLARRGFHLHAWYLAAERSGWRPRHVAVRGAEGLRGIVPAYLTGPGSLHNLHDRWLGPLSSPAAAGGIELCPVISVQAPLALVSEPLGNPDLLSVAVLHQVFETLEHRAFADEAKAVVWPWVEAGSPKLLEVAYERGYAVLYAGSTARLPVRWASFEDYVSTRSKNVRRTIKADLRASGTLRLRATLESDFRAAVPAMNALCRDAFRRRNGREAALPEAFFEELSRHPSEGIRAQLTWQGGRLVGTSLNVMTPELLEGTLLALSPDHQGGPAYYGDLCYEPIRLACSEAIAEIDLGATALYPKVLRGAVLRRRVTLLRGTTPARHRLLAALGHLVARRTAWKERRALGSLWGPHLFAEETPLSLEARGHA
ncbi:MAG TPA: peptidogalycan biosysnthesis protein [Gemmatimonadales bacterium]|nr:peptidogalycan biosysnthesis protein [Gemmatimonadales bacterium]